MDDRWQLQDAKNRLSRLVERAVTEGPQTITVRGQEKVVVVSVDEYRRLSRPDSRLVAFLRDSPLSGTELDIVRDDDSGREVTL